MKHGCINLDWLEVFCMEDPHFPLEPLRCIELGFVVKEREYGTPQYSQMFTCYRGNVPVLEVRRLPYSIRREGGIFEEGSCHIRYVNRSCYALNPLQEMTNFIKRARLTFRSISRCDICVDFVRFDNGDTPQEFIAKYLTDKVIKMHQAKLRGVSRNADAEDYVESFSFGGRDSITSKHINSLKWGGKGCPVSTKLYNKVQEMKDTNYKSYIVDQWISAGLVKRKTVEDKQGKRVILTHDGVECDVWRLEFSVKLQGAKLIETENGGVIEFSLSTIDNRDKLMNIFQGLALQYWDFRKPEVTANGRVKKSNRLKRIAYIKTKILSAYVPKHLSNMLDLTRFERSLVRKLDKWANSIYANADDVYHLRNTMAFISRLFRSEMVGVAVDENSQCVDPQLMATADYQNTLKMIRQRIKGFGSELIINLLDFYENAWFILNGELSKRNDQLAVSYANAPF